MRIVIVEDEKQIRDGLAKLTEKISSSYYVVGKAADGIQGVQCIREQYPDVVITDVQMAGMDGLEMIGTLKDEGIHPKYIVISAYSEFKYAQKALSYGVTEYLLKPISVSELTEALRKVELQLVENAGHREEPSFDAIVRRLVFGDGSIDRKTEKALREKLLPDSGTSFAEILFYFGKNYKTACDALGSQNMRKFQEKSELVCALPMEQQHAMLYVLSGIRDKERFRSWLCTSAEVYGDTQWMRADVLLAFSDSIAGLHEAAMQLIKAMPWKISLPDEPLLVVPEVFHTETRQCIFPIEIENKIRVAICSHDTARVVRQFQNFVTYFSGQEVYQPQEIRECYMRFFWTTLNLAKEVNILNTEQLNIKNIMEDILNAKNLRELNGAAKCLCNFLGGALEEKIPAEENIIIQRAKSLIHEFYSSGITLEEIASKLNITPEYLSMHFHKETGKTFGTYIRDYRVMKARELLIGTQMKLNQIAERVGYSDTKYFSQVFKKCTGQLPTDYRRSHK